MTIPGNFLAPENYYLRILAHSPHLQMYDMIENTVSFRIEDVGSLRSVFHDDRVGLVEPVLKWTDEANEPAGRKKMTF